MEPVLAAAIATGRLLVLVLGPLFVACALLHLVELQLSRRLVSRFGWRGVLATGWIGVPVHELSHAAACVLFGHRIESMRLFAPDSRTGRLGDVRHAWDRRSLYQQVGRFFIGIAPLAGGSLALLLLTLLLGPQLPAGGADGAAGGAGGILAVAAGTAARARDFGLALVEPAFLGRWTSWAYLYLALCIGAHMSPSGTDLKGSGPGLLLLVVLTFLGLVAWTLAGGEPAALEGPARAGLAPLLALLALALVLLLAGWAVVFLVTLPFRARFD